MASLVSSSLLVVASTVFVKLLTLLNQFFLGHLLEIENFGFYATALALVSFVQWTRNGAVFSLISREQILEGKTHSYNYVMFYNVLSSLFLLLICLFSYSQENYIWLILLSQSCVQLLSACGLLNRVQYIKDENFKMLSIYEVKYGLVLAVSTLISAIYFKDERCFAFGGICSCCYELYSCHKRKLWSEFSKLKLSIKLSFTHYWNDGKWLLLGSLGSVLVLKGGFLIVGEFEDNYSLGLYYFSFQIASSIGLLIGDAIRKVLFSFFVRVSDKQEKIEKYFKFLLYSCVFVIPLSILAMYWIEPTIQFLWKGKWDDSIVLSKIFISSLFMSICISISYSNLESSGHWKLKNTLQVADGLLLLAAAVIGAFIGGVKEVVICVVIRRVLFGYVQIIAPLFLDKYQWKRKSAALVLISSSIFSFFVIVNHLLSSLLANVVMGQVNKLILLSISTLMILYIFTIFFNRLLK